MCYNSTALTIKLNTMPINQEALEQITFDTWIKPHDAVSQLSTAFGLSDQEVYALIPALEGHLQGDCKLKKADDKTIKMTGLNGDDVKQVEVELIIGDDGKVFAKYHADPTLNGIMRVDSCNDRTGWKAVEPAPLGQPAPKRN